MNTPPYFFFFFSTFVLIVYSLLLAFIFWATYPKTSQNYIPNHIYSSFSLCSPCSWRNYIPDIKEADIKHPNEGFCQVALIHRIAPESFPLSLLVCIIYNYAQLFDICAHNSGFTTKVLLLLMIIQLPRDSEAFLFTNTIQVTRF